MGDLNNFSLDQPWDPVSYFEEEEEEKQLNEGCSSSTYSPRHLASLFETNLSSVEHDIQIAKHNEQVVDSVFEHDDDDDYLLNTDTGVKVIEPTYSINRKEVFRDFQRLKKFRESVDQEDLKEDTKYDLYSYEITTESSTDALITKNKSRDDLITIDENINSLIISSGNTDFNLEDTTNNTSSNLSNVSETNETFGDHNSTVTSSEQTDINERLLDLPDVPDQIIGINEINSKLDDLTDEVDKLVEEAENITANEINSENNYEPSTNYNSDGQTNGPGSTSLFLSGHILLSPYNRSISLSDDQVENELRRLPDIPGIPSNVIAETPENDSDDISSDVTSVIPKNVSDIDSETSRSSVSPEVTAVVHGNTSSLVSFETLTVEDEELDELLDDLELEMGGEQTSSTLPASEIQPATDENSQFTDLLALPDTPLNFGEPTAPINKTADDTTVVIDSTAEEVEELNETVNETNIGDMLSLPGENITITDEQGSEVETAMHTSSEVLDETTDQGSAVAEGAKTDNLPGTTSMANTESTNEDTSAQETINQPNTQNYVIEVTRGNLPEEVPTCENSEQCVVNNLSCSESLVQAAEASNSDVKVAGQNAKETLASPVENNTEIIENTADNTANNLSQLPVVETTTTNDDTSAEQHQPSAETTTTNETTTTEQTPSEVSETSVEPPQLEHSLLAIDAPTVEAQRPPAVERTMSESQIRTPGGRTRHVRFSLDDQHLEREAALNMPSPRAETSEPQLGTYAPTWITDTRECMNCEMRFTVVKRRHHCRACGKVLCATCCNMKFSMPYLDNKAARVCQLCFDIMLAQAAIQLPEPVLSPQQAVVSPRLPEAPPPYSETVRHAERHGSTSSDAPPYEPTTAPPGATITAFNEPPAPIFSAGAIPSNSVLPSPAAAGFQELPTFPTSLPAYTPSSSSSRSSRSNNNTSGGGSSSHRNRTESEMSAVIMFNSTTTNLPPVLRRDGEESRIINNPDLQGIFNQIHDATADPVSFIVNKNLVVRVNVVNMECCVEKKCWCFTSDGMGASNQEEIVILIKIDSTDVEDNVLTRKVLQQMNFIFEKAKHGHPVSDLEQVELDSSMTCTNKNTALMFFKPTLQCQKSLLLPTSPYLFGLYITTSEIPWAKNFPLRLLLRIGAEFKYYPCPLFNMLDRAPVYNGIGRTILELLADFRNYQYTMSRVAGVTVNLRGKDTILKLPQHRFEEVCRALSSSEDNVFSLAGNFSSSCDGHLVSVEKDGRYKTQTLSIVLKENRKVTCASFIVVSAALKDSNDGIKAKSSIVEDGVMIQVTPDTLKELKASIREMKEYKLCTGDPNAEEKSYLTIEWCASDVTDRPRLSSPIDNTSFDNLTNMKIRHSYDYTSSLLTAKIHWVEVYFLPQDNDAVQRLSARELGQMTSSIAKACMSALSPHLMALIGVEMTRIGLRINLAADFVEYQIGANLSTLPSELLPTLDDKLVPAIHTVMSNAQERVAVELIFQIVQIV